MNYDILKRNAFVVVVVVVVVIVVAVVVVLFEYFSFAFFFSFFFFEFCLFCACFVLFVCFCLFVCFVHFLCICFLCFLEGQHRSSKFPKHYYQYLLSPTDHTHLNNLRLINCHQWICRPKPDTHNSLVIQFFHPIKYSLEKNCYELQ